MHTTKSQIIRELRTYCDGFDTFALAAKSMKVSAAQLSQTLNGKNNVIPEKILKKLGYKSELVYTAVGKKTAHPTRKIARDAGSGEIVTQAHAAANPATTVVETVAVRQRETDTIDMTAKD